MATCTFFSLSCTPQCRLLTKQKSSTMSQTMSLLSPQVRQKQLYHPLKKLVDSPYYDQIEWSKWHIFCVDERVVPKTHVDSNYKLAYDGFISKVKILIIVPFSSVDKSNQSETYE
ncbi:hypothetical protein Lal_00024631 [Lupinus albus]|nr:hypothetical protein Lal_00024631 [Lupinus albus]